MIGMYFLVESPRWLAKKDLLDKALKALAYMRAKSTTSPTVKTGDFVVRFAMFGIPTSAGEIQGIPLNQTKKDTDAIKDGINFERGPKKFAAAIDKMDGDSPACKQYEDLSRYFCGLPDEIGITD
ncbi:hypothetical protein N7522_012771 [Penicillium canescens]|nr:hypothetical protein N7522_012771 [Penicillium canescens]